MRRKILFTGLLLCFLWGCQPFQPVNQIGIEAGSQESETIRIAVDATWPPFEMLDDATNEIVGFDIDLIRSIAEKENFTLEVSDVPFDTGLAGVESCEYDGMISAVSITDERKQSMLFSQNYYESGQVVVLNMSNQKITRMKGLEGKKIGALIGTTGADAAALLGGKKGSIPYASIEMAFLDLLNNQIDAIVVDQPLAAAYLTRYADRLKILGSTFTEEAYAIAVCKEKKDLLEKINRALQALESEGELSRLEDRWISGHENEVQADAAVIYDDIIAQSELNNAEIELSEGEFIVFVSLREGNKEIFRMNTQGEEQIRLTVDSKLDDTPVVSPDGKKIAFVSNRSGSWQIFTMDANGKNLQQLTEGTEKNWRPVWSPDGTRIAFESFRDGNFEIYIMDANGENEINLTNHPAGDAYPSWSPDGARIAFMSTRNENSDIYVMDVETQGVMRLTEAPEPDAVPLWSPVGEQIAFTSWRDGNPDIYIINANGSMELALTNSQAKDDYASWSPDGTQVVFQSTRDGNWEIYRVSSDGLVLERLSEDDAQDIFPLWSPQLDAIVFQSERDEDMEIYLLTPEDGEYKRLTTSNTFDGAPGWGRAP